MLGRICQVWPGKRRNSGDFSQEGTREEPQAHRTAGKRGGRGAPGVPRCLGEWGRQGTPLRSSAVCRGICRKRS